MFCRAKVCLWTLLSTASWSLVTSRTCDAPCASDEYKVALLVVLCGGGTCSGQVSLRKGQNEQVITYPVNLLRPTIRMVSELTDMDLELEDPTGNDGSVKCVAGASCQDVPTEAYDGCSNIQDYCLSYEGMNWSYTGDKQIPPVTEEYRCQGQVTRILDLRVRGSSGGLATITAYNEPLQPCPALLPGCRLCSEYPGCGPLETPMCNGSSTVVCLRPTTTSATIVTMTTTSTFTKTSFTRTATSFTRTTTIVTMTPTSTFTKTSFTRTATSFTRTTTTVTMTPTSTFTKTSFTRTATSFTRTTTETTKTATGTSPTSTMTSSRTTQTSSATSTSTYTSTKSTATSTMTFTVFTSVTTSTSTTMTSISATSSSSGTTVTKTMTSATTTTTATCGCCHECYTWMAETGAFSTYNLPCLRENAALQKKVESLETALQVLLDAQQAEGVRVGSHWYNLSVVNGGGERLVKEDWYDSVKHWLMPLLIGIVLILLILTNAAACSLYRSHQRIKQYQDEVQGLKEEMNPQGRWQGQMERVAPLALPGAPGYVESEPKAGPSELRASAAVLQPPKLPQVQCYELPAPWEHRPAVKLDSSPIVSVAPPATPPPRPPATSLQLSLADTLQHSLSWDFADSRPHSVLGVSYADRVGRQPLYSPALGAQLQ